MFPHHARFKTVGIDEVLSEQIQRKLWEILERDLDEGKPLDYLQVFELFEDHVGGRPTQHIRQRQEQPERKRIHTLTDIEKPISNVTVWIIDSGSYCTMLLPDEY